jgi:2-keto-4-pentenoate hydratase/2-oxohepta-3-ene-1,7-dioic acid hydratase in catechol pathway
MKFARIQVNSPDGPTARLVVAQPEKNRVVDLVTAKRIWLERNGATRAAALRVAQAMFPSSLTAAIGLGDVLLGAANLALESAANDASIDLNTVRFLPAADPPTMRDSTAYEMHIDNMSKRFGHSFKDSFLTLPPYYKGNPTTLIAHEEEMIWPHYAKVMDFELELGLVVGKAGRNVRPEDALNYLFGVTIFNDFSARDMQKREMEAPLGPAKGKDFATAVGPWVVTRDEIDVNNLTMVARINGEEWSRGNSSTATWTPADLIAYASQSETLTPGELIGSGTVGFGCGSELGKFPKAGDVIELEVSGIGILRNKLGQPETGGWLPEKKVSKYETT